MNQFTMCNMIDELSNQVDIKNDKRWMPVNNNISALILMLDVTHGSWVVLVKAKENTSMLTHYHTKPLYVFTVYGHWYYPEHSAWEAKSGHFLFEVPGELHTPTFIEDTLLFSVVTGPIIYPGQNGEKDIVTDVYTHVNSIRQHYKTIGLDEKEMRRIMR